MGVIERNLYLVKRYAVWEVAWFVWTVANTLTIIFIAKGVEAAGGSLDVKRETTVLLIGAVIWSYLGILFEIITETVGVGALGRDDRVHVHGSALPGRPSARDGGVRDPLRADPDGAPIRGDRRPSSTSSSRTPTSARPSSCSASRRCRSSGSG